MSSSGVAVTISNLPALVNDFGPESSVRRLGLTAELLNGGSAPMREWSKQHRTFSVQDYGVPAAALE